MRMMGVLAAGIGVVGVVLGGCAADGGGGGKASDPAYVLGQTMTRLEGGEESLTKYEGEVVLVVNTASKCGLTPQYEGLESMYEEYRERGFVVLGFPANNFGQQEPGTDGEIAAFCERNFGVSFPMFSKISVMGEDQHALYRRLTGMPEPIGGDVTWNFQKYLIDRDGRVVAMFGPRTPPGDPGLRAAVEGLLGE